MLFLFFVNYDDIFVKMLNGYVKMMMEVVSVVYLELEDVIANAIIELNKIDDSREVLFETACYYGEEVLNNLRKKCQFARMKIGNGSIKRFEEKYLDYFNPYYVNGKFGYYLNDDKSIKLLEMSFRDNLPDEFVSAFILSKDKLLELKNKQIELSGEKNSKEVLETLGGKNTYQLKKVRIKENTDIGANAI